jgi:outer membrane autotransporter protein
VHGDQVYAEARYRFAPIRDHQLQPFLNVAHAQLRADTTRGHNGDAALAVPGSRLKTSTATLGLRDAYTSKASLQLHASLAWQQGWGDLVPKQRMRFLAGGDDFVIAGVPPARHALLANLGIAFPLARNVRMDASCIGQFATRFRDQGARLSLNVAF